MENPTNHEHFERMGFERIRRLISDNFEHLPKEFEALVPLAHGVGEFLKQNPDKGEAQSLYGHIIRDLDMSGLSPDQYGFVQDTLDQFENYLSSN